MERRLQHDGERAPGRMTRDARRARLLRSARAEFAQSGYDGASIAAIARAADCSVPLLYKHFDSKEALFAAALDDVMQSIERRLDEWLAVPGHGSTAESWREFVPRLLADESYVEMLRLRMLAAMVDRESVRAALRSHHQRKEARVTRFVQAGVQAGTIRPDVDPGYVTWVWVGLSLAGCYRDAIETDGRLAMAPIASEFFALLAP